MATPAPDLAERYDVRQTVDYITQGGYRNVALQFPDEQLADSPSVSQLLQQQLGDRARVFILADTAYNPLGVDEVAAQHLAAQCVIHYGRASLVPVNSLPAFFVLPKEQLDVQATADTVRQAISTAVTSRCTATAGATAAAGGGGGFRAVVVLVDQGYHHLLTELRLALEGAGGGGGGGGEQGVPVPPLVIAHVGARSLSPQAPARAANSGNATTTGTAGCCSPAAAAAAEPTGSSRSGAQPAAPLTSTAEAVGASAAAPTAAACSAPSEPPSAAGSRCQAQEPQQQQQQPNSQAVPGAAEAKPCGAACGSDGAGRGCTAAASRGPEGDQAAHTAGLGERQQQPVASASGSGDDGSGSAAGGCSTSMVGLTWSLPPGASRRDCLYVWVGPGGSSAHQVLQLTHSTCEWLSYDPAEGGTVRQGLSDDTRRLLKRRNFVVEKARGASIVGLLVGTLGSAGFLEVISALRRMAAAAGKKSYTFLMGKPNPAKLGNFPEVDVFVMVSDAQGLILDSRDYLAPLVSPWEAALAFSGRHIDQEDYRMELRDVLALEQQRQQQPDGEAGDMALQALGGLGLSVATRGSGNSRHEVVACNAAEYLALKRTFKGLEMPATGASPKVAEMAVEGRSGRAAVYTDEGPQEASAS